MSENEQTPAHAVTQMGATFAERKAAYEKATKVKPAAKQVDPEADDVEDKAVAKKSTTRKKG